jgi:pimeloyl-ACP methyl ester carboxylesterase
MGVKNLAAAIVFAVTASLATNTAMAASATDQALKLAEKITYHYADVGGIKIFYREAGDSRKPTILLLHGFPSSSHMFRELIPRLSPHFHIIAPDYPGFGNSDAPSADQFTPTFVNLADVMEAFVVKMGITHLLVYMQDFGGPVGFRLAVKHPEWIDGLVVQNANAYLDGLSAHFLKDVRERSGVLSAEQKSAIDHIVSPESTKHLYLHGTRNPDGLSPDGLNMDAYTLQNPDSHRIQSALITNYYTNVDQYPKWQEFLKAKQPPTLIVWGKNDMIFLSAGAEAFKRDVPKTEIHYYDTGHFALEEDVEPISKEIIRFFGRLKR